MSALIVAVILASLVGSLHCAGMCGVFAAMATSPARTTQLTIGGHRTNDSAWTLNAAYSVGRLITYCLIGVIAGLVGRGIDQTGALVGVQRAAVIFAGGFMVLFGLITLARAMGVRLPHAAMPPSVVTLAGRLHTRSAALPPMWRALSIGMLTTLLPCGWLYAFAVTASGTAHPGSGALVMAAFWLGTLPILLSIGAGVRAITGSFRRHVPAVTSLALIVIGLWTLSGRLAAPMLGDLHVAAAHGPVDQAELLMRTRALDWSRMPCCGDEQSITNGGAP